MFFTVHDVGMMMSLLCDTACIQHFGYVTALACEALIGALLQRGGADLNDHREEVRPIIAERQPDDVSSIRLHFLSVLTGAPLWSHGALTRSDVCFSTERL